MCGIAGFIDFNRSTTKDTLVAMTDTLEHRGPDSSGHEVYTLEKATVGFGHRRLSILDLSIAGHQPMCFNDKIILYNGEVYNFREVRSELEIEGYTFQSDSDTEVILKAFDKWGPDAVAKLNGMFAFAILDTKENKFYLFRDRTGVKPLYYYYYNGLLLFASELKAFHKHPSFNKSINQKALTLFLQCSYIPAPHCIFNHTKKLLPGYYSKIDLNTNDRSLHQYWNAEDAFASPKNNKPESEVLKELDTLMTDSSNLRMVSDVPVGVFLSGGYDSSAVAALIQKDRTQKLNTYTIGFEFEEFNESVYAEQVAKHLGTEQHTYFCSTSEALAIIPKLAFYFDEPFGDQSAIPTMLVCQFARQDVTVALSADGGDELLFGYRKYEDILGQYQKYSKVPKPLQPVLASAMDIAYPVASTLGSKLKSRFEYNYEALRLCLKDGISTRTLLQRSIPRITDRKLAKIIDSVSDPKLSYLESDNDLFHQLTPIDQMLLYDYRTFLVDDVLTKVDRAGMSASLEGREPLLDYRLFEYCAKLPSALKYKNKIPKYLLRELTHKYLPQKLMDRPKMGFGVPLVHWMRNELKEYMDKYLDPDFLQKQGIFDVEMIGLMKDNYYSGKDPYFSFLWNVAIFQMWYDRWMS